MVNSNKLKALMLEHGYTFDQLAKEVGISRTALNNKVNNKISFKLEEVNNIARVFNLTQDDLHLIFFRNVVA